MAAVVALLRGVNVGRRKMAMTELREAIDSLHVGFLARAPRSDVVKAIDASEFQPEEFAVVGSELYLHLPNGMARTGLPDFVLRRLKIPATIRNWNTLTKLVELSNG